VRFDLYLDKTVMKMIIKNDDWIRKYHDGNDLNHFGLMH